MADNENYIENIQFGEDEEIYPIRDAEAHEEIDTNKEEIDNEIEQIKEDYVEKEGGELADTIITYEDEETTVNSFTDFISNFISGSKVAKWFKDFRAGVEYILHVGSLVNNCVTDNAQLPLSAAQGKVLMDELTSVKSDLTELGTITRYDYTIVDAERTGSAILYKIGNNLCVAVINVIIAAGHSTSSSETLDWTIPSELRPNSSLRIPFIACNGATYFTYGRLSITGSGSVSFNIADSSRAYEIYTSGIWAIM